MQRGADPLPAPARGCLLWLRAALLSTVALACGAFAHSSAHGRLPGPGTMALLALAGTTVAAPLLRRPASTRRVVLLLVLGQAAVHAVLTALSGHRGDEPAHGSGPAWLHHLTEDLTGAHALMAVAHAAAAAAVGLWLAVGERAVWELVLWTGRAALPARPALPDVPAAAEAVPPEETALRPRVLMIATSLSRRGPPVPV